MDAELCLLVGVIILAAVVWVVGEVSLTWPLRNPRLRQANRDYDLLVEAFRKASEERKKKESKP